MPGAAEPTGPAAPAGAGWRDWWIDVVWIVTLVAWASGWCLTAADRLGPTYDEPFYLKAGLEAWQTGVPERTATHGTMPLPVDLLSFPLHRHGQQTGRPIDPFDTERLLEHLGAARAMTLFWFGLLVVSALRLGRAAGGPWAGRVAAGLIGADPNFLAHSALATTDVAAAAGLVAFARAAYAGRAGGWWPRVVLPGLWLGFALLCKLSALLFGGVVLVTLEVGHRLSSGALSRPPGAGLGGWARRVAGAAARSALAVAAVLAIGVAVAVVAYGTPPPGTRPLDVLLEKIPDGDPLRPRYERLAREYERPPYAAVALAFQSWHNSRWRPVYLNGGYYPEGRWWLSPAMLAVKLPVPVLALAAACLARPRALANPLALAALLALAATLAAGLQIGVRLRLLLPLVAVGYVGVAVAAARGFGRFGAALGVLAVGMTAWASASVWPHGLSYLNPLAGGPGAAFERVSDSNHDWGQGVPELREWHRASGEPPMAVWYFGTDPAAGRPPLVRVFVESAAIETAADFRAVVGPNVLAVGMSVLTLHPFDPPPKAVGVHYLRTLKPMARTTTFVIYDLRGPYP